MELVAAMPKPPGFFDPDNPAGLPVPPERDRSEEEETDDAEGEEAAGPEGAAEASAEATQTADAESAGDQDADEEGDRPRRRTPLLDFANSDIAFANDLVFEGNYHGFNTYNVEDPTEPRLLASIVCPGGQGDVSIVGDLLIMSAQETRGRLDCGLQGSPRKSARSASAACASSTSATSPVLCRWRRCRPAAARTPTRS